MTSPKTLHLTNAYHATSGGIRTFYRALMAEAEVRQRQIRLVVPAERSVVEPCGRYGVIHAVAAPRAPWFDRRYRLLSPVHYLGSRSPIARILASERADVVEVCDKYTLCHVARLAAVGWYALAPRPTLVGLSCERMDDNVAAYLSSRPGVLQAAHRYLRQVYAPSFDVHVANSAYTADELRVHARCGDVEVCPPGVDAGLFASAHRDASLRLSLLDATGGGPSSHLVFYAGRLSPEKNLRLLLEAVGELERRRDARQGRLSDVRLVIAGDGPQAASLRDVAARVAPGRVRFLGNISDRRTLAAHYASADVFAHPNPREPFGIGPLEAMAAGVPVVVPNAGGVLSYAHEGNAWIAAPEPAAMADAIADAALGRDSARVRRAAATARAYAWDEVAGRYFDLLDRLHHARLEAVRRPSASHRPRTAAAGPQRVATRSRARATTPGPRRARWRG